MSKTVCFITRNFGKYDPDSLKGYESIGGFRALRKALTMEGCDIADVLAANGVQGRGGAAYDMGKKWRQAREVPGAHKCVVCNADEGEPGTFKDRELLIAGWAVGADNGYIYLREEYSHLRPRLLSAIAQCEAAGYLGEDILGSGLNYRIHLYSGAGAYVCGEGSALTASIEGNRGMPRVKPPRTVEQGLWARPTVLNNVETFSNVPLIIRRGSAWYRSIGTERSHGTKAFALTGNVVNTGLIEVPMGTTLRQIIFEIGGGIKDGKKFKAVQIGGPSGGCIPASLIDTPIDYESLSAIGSMMGSGGLIVMDEDTCMVDIAKFFLEFTVDESCGKCTPCRVGTKRLLELLTKITEGRGTMEDLDTLRDLADMIENTALCGLGKSAPKPVISTLNAFRDEYVAHIRDRRCPAGVCSKLRVYSIDPAKCKGCSKCARNCPASAIHGTLKSPYTIDQDASIRCGSCVEQCAFGAITVEK